MTKSREGKRAETEKKLRAAFEKIKQEGRPTGPSAFAKHVGVHRTYLYTFPSLIAELSAYGKLTQPAISRRGGGLTKADAKRRELEDKIRREHGKWARELPGLRERIKEAEKKLREREDLIQDLRERFDRLKRVYEHLMLIAVEAGVSPSELEQIQKVKFQE